MKRIGNYCDPWVGCAGIHKLSEVLINSFKKSLACTSQAHSV
jgi:hypothetical protein